MNSNYEDEFEQKGISMTVDVQFQNFDPKKSISFGVLANGSPCTEKEKLKIRCGQKSKPHVSNGDIKFMANVWRSGKLLLNQNSNSFSNSIFNRKTSVETLS